MAARSVRDLAALAGSQPLRIGHCPLEFVALCCVGQIFEREFVNDADAVGPVGVDAEAGHVGDDEEGRILEGEGVLAQLVEGGVEVLVLALVLPGEAVSFPDVGPAAAAGVLARAALEAVALSARIVFGRGWLVQEPAEVDEVLLGGGALVELRCPPLGDKLLRIQCRLLQNNGCCKGGDTLLAR